MGGDRAYQHFSTRGFASVERRELWEHHNARALLPLGVRSIDGAVLEASEDNVRLTNLTFARVHASPHVVERTANHIAQSTVDGVALFFSLAGDAFFYHQDGVHLQRPGTLLVCDVSQPFLRGFAHGLQEFVLTVPRRVFEDVTESSLPREPLVRSFADVPGGDTHAAALARLVRRTLAEPTADSLAATEDSALELLRMMLAPAGGAGAHRAGAIAWIRRNLGDPSISVTVVADAVGVSERTLARAFAASGGTVARTILDLRLERAHRILSRPGSPAVQEVAVACGFVSASHFSRVFRERFGQPPAAVAASAAHSAPRMPDPAIR
ncbi:AraC family transcriptional regulator [Microbacterium sp. SORGH_AS_0888]|uniref:helix-turn-helix transcriptional regulator n=1 Tax=Microbacterium sp. SORGH_AS_0888 TaxID=3041791 RepID=UPI00278904EF|nr:AraC family transcriptional regulator [Microbacterium sp. SORGH_AS_0888]MDQ1129802.1 AraC-like DNA-binding protein [Microbacterium sp. SORGH_AS_0888]